MQLDAPKLDLLTLDGKRWQFDPQANDHVLLVDFWATWCGPCIESLPLLKDIDALFKEQTDFSLVMISLDDDPSKAREFARTHDLPGTQLTARWDSEIVNKLRISSIPHTEIISRFGKSEPIDVRSADATQIIRDVLYTRRSDDSHGSATSNPSQGRR